MASLFVKEKLYIGEATVASVTGLILGPHCLGWINPLSWESVDYITLEICRIVLCIQIVAVSVELPRKYMKKHWVSVAVLLIPVMTIGWIVVGLFIWVLIPHFDFPSALLVSACVTATDPVLAAAVVGKGKFAERVPGHLRNLLTAESGCNDGMAFPFIFLSLYIITYEGHPGEILKHWVIITILWECFFGVIIGVTLGFLLRKALFLAEKWNLIDRESFLALFIFLALTCAGIGSMLGVDDLLVSFAAGTAFGWNGDFSKKTEESHVSTVIDLLLNLTFFVYFGSIVPWAEFDNASLGLEVWRLIILAIVIIFLRRIPAVLALKAFTPDIKTWREALFCGHFGPIGVGAIFASILARKKLEDHYITEEVPLMHLPDVNFPYYQLIMVIWPVVCFIVITSIIIHGSSVAVLALGRRLNRMALTVTLTATTTHDQGPSWMSRLQKLNHTSTLYSLHRIDTDYPKDNGAQTLKTCAIETSGIKVRPAGGARRKRTKRQHANDKTSRGGEFNLSPIKERQRPATEFLQLGRVKSEALSEKAGITSSTHRIGVRRGSDASIDSEKSVASLVTSVDQEDSEKPGLHNESMANKSSEKAPESINVHKSDESVTKANNIYEGGLKVILEDSRGEIVGVISKDSGEHNDAKKDAQGNDLHLDVSIHSMGSLRRNVSNFSVFTGSSNDLANDYELAHISHKTLVKKGSKGKGKRFFAHQMDDIVLVENEDGDVIRKYRLNRHRLETKPLSGLIMQRAFSMVGIKNKSIPADPEKVQPVLGNSKAYAETVLQHQQDSRMTKKISALLNSDIYEQNLTSVELGHSDNDKDETEVEKRRRLAALGRIDDHRDENDEE